MIRLLNLFFVVVLVASPLGLLSQKTVSALNVDYRIEIESGRDINRPEIRPKPIVVYNRMYIYNNRAVYVAFDSTKSWNDYGVMDKTTIWKKGKTSYKHEFKDSNCCIMYNEMKKRYRWESTVIEEVIAGRKTNKVIIYDDVNGKIFYVWVDPLVKTSVSPIGFLPVNGLVMRLRNENVVYEVIGRKVVEVPESYFSVDEEKYRFSEKAFRTGFIE
ncbi:MAG: hypothetical protein CL840_18475 [Crocinitomicaceae bacterium]|nr:hypothetical protein [Crocinitomicaceae bacterium]|tara:strand:- start:26826 stop:27473 length:648 start_codon:yes stop_codon:yes gene_type:complete